MLAAVLLLVLCLFIVFFIPNYHGGEKQKVAEKDPRFKKLWNVAQTAIREKKPVRAEKALLTILQFDEKNAAAYNRLGIIYAKERKYDEAIECFEIAQSLDNNASSLHNVGLIYYETGHYDKAAQAFEHALELDGGEPARYIAYAKALEKLGKRSKAIESLEGAYELKPDTAILKHLLQFYENNNDEKNIELTKQRIQRTAQREKKLFGFTIDSTSEKMAKSSDRKSISKEERAQLAKQVKEEHKKAKELKAQKKVEAKKAAAIAKAAKKTSAQNAHVANKKLPKNKKIV